MANNKRIMKELGDVTREPVEGCAVKLPNESDLHLWEVTMDGPSGSVYAGGKFVIHIALPKDYPFKPPVLSFRTKIYHPNVSNDERGAMCLGILKADEWKPPNRIAEVLKLVRTVLAAPQADDPVEQSIANQYLTNRDAFDKVALEWVNKYAK